MYNWASVDLLVSVSALPYRMVQTLLVVNILMSSPCHNLQIAIARQTIKDQNHIFFLPVPSIKRFDMFRPWGAIFEITAVQSRICLNNAPFPCLSTCLGHMALAVLFIVQLALCGNVVNTLATFTFPGQFSRYPFQIVDLLRAHVNLIFQFHPDVSWTHDQVISPDSSQVMLANYTRQIPGSICNWHSIWKLQKVRLESM